MKRLQKISLLLALITLFASCQSNTNVNQILSKTDARKQIMDSIANNSSMAKEMMTAMMNSNNGMAMMQDHMSMMNMMKDKPGMMNAMMEACKKDTGMMSDMCKMMMQDPKMMDMMHKMEGGNMDMNKMNGMDTMKTMNHKMKH